MPAPMIATLVSLANAAPALRQGLLAALGTARRTNHADGRRGARGPENLAPAHPVLALGLGYPLECLAGGDALLPAELCDSHRPDDAGEEVGFTHESSQIQDRIHAPTGLVRSS